MNRTNVTCTENEMTVGADVLEINSRRLIVVLDGTDIRLTLYKDTPHQSVYVGNSGGREFTSTGD